MKSNVFVQSDVFDDVVHLEISEATTGAALKLAVLELIPAGHNKSEFLIFIEDEDGADALAELVVAPQVIRVHAHRHKHIDVQVRYNGKEVSREFRPSATIGRIKLWAAEHFGISKSDGAEFMLQIHGTDKRPDADVHVGALVKYPQHAITFDLVPSPRING